ncbi:Stk1 family PASTA domain-containing Ser/Thr kinase [uncultured Pseudokineococcus sp.]|uniref:Stk1 family PASTA domain-containing Ser/Thr kinase n=1 Tax=uncultured Pseudokineococcus sp. TaxID=1642928 RepID=UPI00260BCBD4|nr:Stk1 family PASTA domain-containing Ser/Thr kinase [uncultured Pseudokineococcus sp.]
MAGGLADGVADPLVGASVDGRYTVVSRIARGGMATVYRATDTRLDRDVALKVMHPHLAQDPDFVARFHREAVAAARVSSPSVVGVFDQGRDDALGHGVVYLVLELVPGSTLRDLLAAEGPLRAGTALAVLEPVLEALAAAHRAGVVHRDVKPENVLLTDDGRVKVADFGLARAASTQTSTATGVLMGTVAYLSPELVLHGTADARTDVYAAGITLFEMLTGTQPFTGEVPIQVAHQHVTRDVPAPSELVDGVPAELDDLVLWMTARDPDERPADARELVHEVRALRRDLPVTAADAAPRPTGRAPERGAGAATPALATAALPGHREHVGPLPVGEPAAVEGGAVGAGTRASGHDASSPGTTSPTTALPDGTGGRRGSRSAAAAVPAPAPAGAPGRRPRRRRRALGALLALVLTAVLVGGAAWWVLLGPGADVAAPPTAGLPAEVAQDVLADAGLASEVSERFDDGVPAGTVIDSSPGAGQDVGPGEVVRLFVSRGSEFAAVPDLVGDDLGDARREVEGLGLVLEEGEPVYDEQVPEGDVVSQEPEDGEELRRGEGVEVVASRGREPLDVPDVVGRPRGDAVDAVSEAGLEAVVTEENSDEVPEGEVVRQSPEDGTLFAGDDVALVVSLGPELVPVPDVVGLQLEAARTALEDAGFVVEEESVLGGFFGTVRDQSVDGGSEAEPGSTVTLTVV